jgi:hypothetical protein
MGQLVTDFRFLMASPYSSQVRLTSPEGSSPFFEEKPWTVCGQDSNVGQDAHGAHAPGYWLLAGPSLSTPYSKGFPRAAIGPTDGPAFALLALMGRRSVFSSISLSYLWLAREEVSRHRARPMRGRPEVTCARPMKGRGDRHGERVDLGGRLASLLDASPYKTRG